MDINRNNYESFFLLYLDRELNEMDRKEVEKFLVENTDLQKEFTLLQNTIQWPADIVFEQKELLYRKEEKRRVIPVYWMRMAAAIALILTGSWFLMVWIAKNPGQEIAGKGISPSATASAEKDQAPSNQGSENGLNQDNKNGAQEKDQVTIPSPKDQDKGNHTTNLATEQASRNQSGQKGITGDGNGGKSTNQKNRSGREAVGVKQEGIDQKALQNQDPGQLGPEPVEMGVAEKKSNTALELQTGVNRAGTDQKQIAVLSKTETPVLITAVAATDNQMRIENTSQPDLQTDNAISVIALNDRNKAITGFFNKLTRRASDDETVNNTKKLRVSVFQISY